MSTIQTDYNKWFQSFSHLLISNKASLFAETFSKNSNIDDSNVLLPYIYIYFFLFNIYHEFGTMYEDKHTPLLSANLCAQQHNGGFTVNKQQRRGSNPRPSGRKASTLPPRHGSTGSTRFPITINR